MSSTAIQSLGRNATPIEGMRRWGAIAALVLPLAISYSLPPSMRMVNQCMAVAGWGLWIMALAPAGLSFKPLGPLLIAAVIIGVTSILAAALGRSSLSIAVTGVSVLTCAAIVAAIAAACARHQLSGSVFAVFCWGAMAVALINALVGIAQVIAPDWPHMVWLPQSRSFGRAGGFMNQANQLATLLSFGLVATWYLREIGRIGKLLAGVAVTTLLFGLAFSGSRAGSIGLVALLLTLLIAPVLPRDVPGRRRSAAVVLTGVYVAASFIAIQVVSAHSGADASGDTGYQRWMPQQTGSSIQVRMTLWQNSLDLIRQQPWTGTGFGNFNLAWTLTPLDARPWLELDANAHNLPLHLMAELGVPLGGLVCVLLAIAFWRLCRSALRRRSTELLEVSLQARTCALWVLVALLHSLLEFPLWFVYLLLPTAFVWGFGLALDQFDGEKRVAADPASGAASATVVKSLGLLMIAGGLAAWFSYAAGIDRPLEPDPEVPGGRLAIELSNNPWHAYLLNFRAAFEASRPSPAVVRGGMDYLSDPRLLRHWAKVLEAQGRDAEAAYVLQRSRELEGAPTQPNRLPEPVGEPLWRQLARLPSNAPMPPP